MQLAVQHLGDHSGNGADSAYDCDFVRRQQTKFIAVPGYDCVVGNRGENDVCAIQLSKLPFNIPRLT